MFDLKIRMDSKFKHNKTVSSMSFAIASDPEDIAYLHKVILFALGNPAKQEMFMNSESGVETPDDEAPAIGFQ